MEGRRVSRRQPRRNPLYVLFMGLLALSLVLLITVVVLGFKLKSARSDLAAAQTKIEQLRGGQQTGEDGQITNGEDGSLTGENDVSDPAQGDNMSGDNQTGGDMIDWLDLTGQGLRQAEHCVRQVLHLLHNRRRESAERPGHEL